MLPVLSPTGSTLLAPDFSTWSIRITEWIGTKVRSTPANLALEFLLGRIDENRGAFPENQLADFHEAVYFTVADATRIQLVELSLIVKDDPVSAFFRHRIRACPLPRTERDYRKKRIPRQLSTMSTRRRTSRREQRSDSSAQGRVERGKSATTWCPDSGPRRLFRLRIASRACAPPAGVTAVISILTPEAPDMAEVRARPRSPEAAVARMHRAGGEGVLQGSPGTP